MKTKMTTNKMSKEADHIYVLMTDKYRISRNMRAHWYFDRLNTHMRVEPKTTLVTSPIHQLIRVLLTFLSVSQL